MIGQVFYEWEMSDRLMKSAMVTGNLLSGGKMPTTPPTGREIFIQLVWLWCLG